MPGQSTDPLFELICSQIQQNKDLISEANKLCDLHRNLTITTIAIAPSYKTDVISRPALGPEKVSGGLTLSGYHVPAYH